MFAQTALVNVKLSADWTWMIGISSLRCEIICWNITQLRMMPLQGNFMMSKRKVTE